MKISFGDFHFDDAARELRRGSETVALSPKAFRLLELLLEARPRALRREEIQDALWPDTHVSHTSLPRVVNELRGALGDDPKAPQFVRTVHGFGYAFKGDREDPEDGSESAPVSRSTAPLVPFSLLWGGRQIPLSEGDTVLGRDAACDVRIDSPKVSRRHARIRVRGRVATIEDMGSKNGTILRSAPVEGEVELSDGDEIVIGPADLLFLSSGDGSTETEARRRSRS